MSHSWSKEFVTDMTPPQLGRMAMRDGAGRMMNVTCHSRCSDDGDRPLNHGSAIQPHPQGGFVLPTLTPATSNICWSSSHLPVSWTNDSTFPPADVVLQVGNHYFPAHRRLLVTNSGYFQYVFATCTSSNRSLTRSETVATMQSDNTDYPPPQHSIMTHTPDLVILAIPLQVSLCQAFSILLESMYTSHLRLDVNNVSEVLLCSRVLDIPFATEICHRFLTRVQRQLVPPRPSPSAGFTFSSLQTTTTTGTAVTGHLSLVEVPNVDIPFGPSPNPGPIFQPLRYSKTWMLPSDHNTIPATTFVPTVVRPIPTNRRPSAFLPLPARSNNEISPLASTATYSGTTTSTQFYQRPTSEHFSSNFDHGKNGSGATTSTDTCERPSAKATRFPLSVHTPHPSTTGFSTNTETTTSPSYGVPSQSHNLGSDSPPLAPEALSRQRPCSLLHEANQTASSDGDSTPHEESTKRGDRHQRSRTTKIAVDVACCDGPVKFQRVLNENCSLVITMTGDETGHMGNRRAKSTERRSRYHHHRRRRRRCRRRRIRHHPQTLEIHSVSGVQNQMADTDSSCSPSAGNSRSSTSQPWGDEHSESDGRGETYRCFYCRQTFKSQCCYVKHKWRHLNPMIPDNPPNNGVPIAEAAQVDSTLGDVARGSSVEVTPSGASVRNAKESNNEELPKALEINVPFYPCKLCGCKFPSYYFVHKHRRNCHQGARLTPSAVENDEHNSSSTSSDTE